MDGAHRHAPQRGQPGDTRLFPALEPRLYSVAAEHDGSLASPEWLLSYGIVKEAEGPNDGVVSVASARYGEDCGIWPGDHFTLVNWKTIKGGEPLDKWRELMERWKKAGF